jgi:hypothetical protein
MNETKQAMDIISKILELTYQPYPSAEANPSEKNFLKWRMRKTNSIHRHSKLPFSLKLS